MNLPPFHLPNLQKILAANHLKFLGIFQLCNPLFYLFPYQVISRLHSHLLYLLHSLMEHIRPIHLLHSLNVYHLTFHLSNRFAAHRDNQVGNLYVDLALNQYENHQLNLLSNPIDFLLVNQFYSLVLNQLVSQRESHYQDQQRSQVLIQINFPAYNH